MTFSAISACAVDRSKPLCAVPEVYLDPTPFRDDPSGTIGRLSLLAGDFHFQPSGMFQTTFALHFSECVVNAEGA